MNKLLIITLLPIIALLAYAKNNKIPSWANNSTSKSGSIVTIVCVGLGPDLSTAKQDAVHSCITDVQNYLVTEYQVNTLSTQTEKDSTYQSTISSNTSIKNISCNVLKEKIYEEDNQVRIYNLCEYDLNKIVSKPIKNNKKRDLSSLSKIKDTNIDSKYRDISSSNRTIFISTIPMCSTVSIEGSSVPRVIKCTKNPIGVTISSNDSQITLRALNKAPKIISVNELLEVEDESLQIIFD